MLFIQNFHFLITILQYPILKFCIRSMYRQTINISVCWNSIANKRLLLTDRNGIPIAYDLSTSGTVLNQSVFNAVKQLKRENPRTRFYNTAPVRPEEEPFICNGNSISVREKIQVKGGICTFGIGLRVRGHASRNGKIIADVIQKSRSGISGKDAAGMLINPLLQIFLQFHDNMKGRIQVFV